MLCIECIFMISKQVEMQHKPSLQFHFELVASQVLDSLWKKQKQHPMVLINLRLVIRPQSIKYLNIVLAVQLSFTAGKCSLYLAETAIKQCSFPWN